MSESFAELFEQSLQTLEMQPGSIVTGIVVDVDGDLNVVEFKGFRNDELNGKYTERRDMKLRR